MELPGLVSRSYQCPFVFVPGCLGLGVVAAVVEAMMEAVVVVLAVLVLVRSLRIPTGGGEGYL